MTILKNLYSNRWPCGITTLEIIRKFTPESWDAKIRSSISNQDRELAKLIELMKKDSNNSISHAELDTAEGLVRSTDKLQKKYCRFTADGVTELA